MKNLIKMVTIASALVLLFFFYFISPYCYLMVCSLAVLFLFSFCLGTLYSDKTNEFKAKMKKLTSRVGELYQFVFNINIEKV